MKQCTKEVEIELADGTIIEVTLKVTGIFDEEFNSEATTKGEQGAWLVESWNADYKEELGEEEQGELDEKVEEIVFAEKWDWMSAQESEEESEEVEE